MKAFIHSNPIRDSRQPVRSLYLPPTTSSCMIPIFLRAITTRIFEAGVGLRTICRMEPEVGVGLLGVRLEGPTLGNHSGTAEESTRRVFWRGDDQTVDKGHQR
ncbi:hypothetical protein PM082_015406 [Marasmius tenuissimus]|nr:hypothetical protein PM082_015406 [Marasmius tenuissimus]